MLQLCCTSLEISWVKAKLHLPHQKKVINWETINKKSVVFIPSQPWAAWSSGTLSVPNCGDNKGIPHRSTEQQGGGRFGEQQWNMNAMTASCEKDWKQVKTGAALQLLCRQTGAKSHTRTCISTTDIPSPSGRLSNRFVSNASSVYI